MLTPDPNSSPEAYGFITRFNDQPFRVDVARRLAASDDDALRAAEAAMDWLGDHHAALTLRCADELLDTYNEEWAEGDEEVDPDALPLAADDLRARLAARALTLLDDGRVQVAFADGGLFSGHVVVVETDEDRTPVEVFLEG